MVGQALRTPEKRLPVRDGPYCNIVESILVDAGVKRPLTEVPSASRATMAATATNATIRPYSIMVAPESS